MDRSLFDLEAQHEKLGICVVSIPSVGDYESVKRVLDELIRDFGVRGCWQLLCTRIREMSEAESEQEKATAVFSNALDENGQATPTMLGMFLAIVISTTRFQYAEALTTWSEELGGHPTWDTAFRWLEDIEIGNKHRPLPPSKANEQEEEPDAGFGSA